MNNVLTSAETRKMSRVKIQIELGERAKKLEELGMDHVSACGFISSVMNLGIAAQEQWDDKKQK